ncbi:hypothetical protein [Streptomyces sp. NPDC059080]|uniref:hypothetical protein n=1 Tax=Streptomyces sp. NPDC059080 TaxID=3346718 RepID=UPI0036C16BAB
MTPRTTYDSATLRLMHAADEARLRIDGIGERQLLADDGVTPIYPGIPLGAAEPSVVRRIADALSRDRYRHATTTATLPASELECTGVASARMLRASLLGYGYDVAVWGTGRDLGAARVVIEGPFPAAAAQQMAAALNVYDRLADARRGWGHG